MRRATVTLLKENLRAVWVAGYRVARPLQLRRVTAQDSVRLLIGAGPSTKPGWTRTDITPKGNAIYLDATKPFPFETDSVDLIHSEHMIEHVPFTAGQTMLAECRRVLKPGGRIRIATPDYSRFVELAYTDLTQSGLSTSQLEYVSNSNHRNGEPEEMRDSVILAVNRMFSGHGHRCLYSPDLLEGCLRDAGFHEVKFFEVGESEEEAFCGLEQHGDQISSRSNTFQTMVVEATA
jgi:predicted SAM-dependent methyltransferase